MRAATIAIALLLGCDEPPELYESCRLAVEARCRAEDNQAEKRLAQLREIGERSLEEQVEFELLGGHSGEILSSCSSASNAEAILKCVERTP